MKTSKIRTLDELRRQLWLNPLTPTSIDLALSIAFNLGKLSNTNADADTRKDSVRQACDTPYDVCSHSLVPA